MNISASSKITKAIEILEKGKVAANIIKLIESPTGHYDEILITTIDKNQIEMVDISGIDKLDYGRLIAWDNQELVLLFVNLESYSYHEDSEGSGEVLVISNNTLVFKNSLSFKYGPYGRTYRIDFHARSISILKAGRWLDDLNWLSSRVTEITTRVLLEGSNQRDEETAQNIDLGDFGRF